ncbi:MAG: response regulator [Deltaproteobacteria bacterium]|nr:response regulator [Deltaproteobacteria bacterium]
MTAVKKEVSKRRVLVIDDDKGSLTFIEGALKSDYSLRFASQGAEALVLAQEYFPNVIVLDLDMKNANSYEILSHFKVHPFLSAIPILCLSSESSLDTREKIYSLGATGCLIKPIHGGQLVSDIELILKNANLKMESLDSRRTFFIAYNSHEKQKAIRNYVHKSLQENKKTVFITLTSGENFCSSDEVNEIRNERLLYLQFKGNILAKLPFMDDLSPIIFDLESTIGESTKNWTLIMDDPEIILNIYDKSSTFSHVFMFTELLDRNFSEIAFFCKKPMGKESNERLNQLANMLTGNI